jgi:hypothetical protein
VRAALLALLIGCATSHKAESSFQQEQEVQSDKDVTRKVERGPVKVTRTEEALDGGSVVRRTVTVTERAPEVSTTQEQTDTRSDAHVQAASSSESTFRLGPGFWGWLGIGLAVAGVLFVVVRFKLWRFVL